jgi:hypothetical protein
LPEAGSNLRFSLSDSQGKTAKSLKFNGKILRIEKGALAPGVYFYTIDAEKGAKYSGKVVIK